MNLQQMIETHHDWVGAMGWHNKTVLESLALVASEVGEAVNECRGPEPTDRLAEELADIVLRVMDLAATRGIDLEAALHDKIYKNHANGNYKQRVR